MSEDLAAEVVDMCCANCGKAEIDDVKLKDCDKCDRARYCGDECQQNHQEIHAAKCKERAAAIRDEILFKQPESSHLGDCPICLLPLPLDGDKYVVSSCCGKTICDGCNYANQMRETEQRIKNRCPFCRKILSKSGEEHYRNHEKRAAASDPLALRQIGGIKNKEGDYVSAFEYWIRAAELGDAEAHYNLSFLYLKGNGVEKDEKMAMYHFEEAAIAGHPKARYTLGIYEGRNRQLERSTKHLIIAAHLGHDDSLQKLKEFYKVGLVSKDDLAAALRAHQAAVDATKSPQREEAANFKAWQQELGR